MRFRISTKSVSRFPEESTNTSLPGRRADVVERSDPARGELIGTNGSALERVGPIRVQRVVRDQNRPAPSVIGGVIDANRMATDEGGAVVVADIAPHGVVENIEVSNNRSLMILNMDTVVEGTQHKIVLHNGIGGRLDTVVLDGDQNIAFNKIPGSLSLDAIDRDAGVVRVDDDIVSG